MANTAQNIIVAQRRHQILQVLDRIKSWCSIEYIHAILRSPRWCMAGSGRARKKPQYDCKLSAVSLDMRELKRKRSVEAVQIRHYDELRIAKSESGRHYKTVAFRLTAKGKREVLK